MCNKKKKSYAGLWVRHPLNRNCIFSKWGPRIVTKNVKRGDESVKVAWRRSVNHADGWLTVGDAPPCDILTRFSWTLVSSRATSFVSTLIFVTFFWLYQLYLIFPCNAYRRLSFLSLFPFFVLLFSSLPLVLILGSFPWWFWKWWKKLQMLCQG